MTTYAAVRFSNPFINTVRRGYIHDANGRRLGRMQKVPIRDFFVVIVEDPADDVLDRVTAFASLNPVIFPNGFEPDGIIMRWKSKGRFMKWVRSRPARSLIGWIGPARLAPPGFVEHRAIKIGAAT